MKVNLNLNPKAPKKVNSTIKALLKEWGLANVRPIYLPYIHRESEEPKQLEVHEISENFSVVMYRVLDTWLQHYKLEMRSAALATQDSSASVSLNTFWSGCSR